MCFPHALWWRVAFFGQETGKSETLHTTKRRGAAQSSAKAQNRNATLRCHPPRCVLTARAIFGGQPLAEYEFAVVFISFSFKFFVVVFIFSDFLETEGFLFRAAIEDTILPLRYQFLACHRQQQQKFFALFDQVINLKLWQYVSVCQQKVS